MSPGTSFLTLFHPVPRHPTSDFRLSPGVLGIGSYPLSVSGLSRVVRESAGQQRIIPMNLRLSIKRLERRFMIKRTYHLSPQKK